jgi:hypothetical protein
MGQERRRIAVTTTFAAMALLALVAGIPWKATAADIFFDDFSTEVKGRWRPIQGEWLVKHGVMRHVGKDSPDHDMVLADFPYSEGMIEVKGIARKENSYGFGSLGIVVKHLDDQNFIYFRFGSYNQKNVDGHGPPGWDKVVLGGGKPQIGRKYDLTVIVRNGLIYVCLDEVMIGVLRDPFSGRTGRPGIFTESGAEFDNFRVTRWAR